MKQPSVADVLAKALEVWGPNGEHWIKNKLHYRGAHCMIGGIEQAAALLKANKDVKTEALVKAAYRLPNPYRSDPHSYEDSCDRIVDYNDAEHCRFRDVKNRVCTALKRELGVKKGKGKKRAKRTSR